MEQATQASPRRAARKAEQNSDSHQRAERHERYAQDRWWRDPKRHLCDDAADSAPPNQHVPHGGTTVELMWEGGEVARVISRPPGTKAGG